jgi:hypothetical protein
MPDPPNSLTGQRTQATAAGVYDWCLQGHHHLPCDAEAAIIAQRLFPLAGRTARYNRDFLQRTVQWLVRQGVRQFLDIGSGYPTAGNVHEIAQASAPDARVVYVDLDPDTVAVSNEILAGVPNAVCLQGDLRDPAGILGHPRLGLLDFDRPVGLLLVSVLPFVPGDAAPLVRRYLERISPGSYLALSHVTPPTDERARRKQAELAKAYNATVKNTARLRTRDEVAALFAGTELVPPGLGLATHWKPPPQYRPGHDDEASEVLLGAVARVP